MVFHFPQVIQLNTHSCLKFDFSSLPGLKPFLDNMPGRVLEINPILAGIEDVAIDANGRFKYILCKVYQDGAKDESKLIVRGTAQAEFHGKCSVL